MTPLCLLSVTLSHRLSGFQQRQGLRIFAHQYVTQMLCKARYKMSGIKTMIKHVVEQHQRCRHIMRKRIVHQREVIIRIQHIEYRDRLLVRNIRAAEGDQLVEDRKRVTHSAIGFLSHHIECLLANGDSFFLRYGLQISDRVRHGNTVEIIHLATTQNSWQHFVLLGRSQNENGI